LIKKIYKKNLPESLRNHIRVSIRKAKSPFYYGNKYECNCCKSSFRKMLPKANRPNAECPRCGSLERTRLLMYYLKNETTIFEKKLKVLHFAPESSLYSILSKSNLEYIDGDIHPAYANHIVDITDIKYADDYFDLIICSHVIAHVPDEKKAIQELRRVLSPHGEAIILTYINPNSEETIDHDWINTPELRKEHYGEPDCLRLHGSDFKSTLEKANFKVNQLDYRKRLGQKIMNKNVLGEGPREWIFQCTK